MIDTIAMIGSPASRGAVASVVGAGRASVVGAGRACLAAASAVSAAAAIAASVTMAGPPQRCVATVDCAVMNRFITMPCPAVRACVDQDRRPAYLSHPDTARPTRSCNSICQQKFRGAADATSV
jgi:hypothetical protein